MTCTINKLDFGNPFRAATIFLSHSWNDNEQADYLCRQLNKCFRVWYDRGHLLKNPLNSGLLLGQYVLPRTFISHADFVLFLASHASMNCCKLSREELKIAEVISIQRGGRLGLIELEPDCLPPEYKASVFEKFNLSTARADSQRIIKQIKNRLADLAGFEAVGGKSSSIIYRNSQKLNLILEAISNPAHMDLYRLNAVFRAVEMKRLIEHVASLPDTDRHNICESLAGIYLNLDQPEYSVARENAVYVLSRLEMNNQDLADELRLRYPDNKDSFLYRGFHISLGFLGDANRMHDYVDQLANSRSKTWQYQRRVNHDFHVLYYGSLEGAISQLRESIRTFQPQNLLELNVFTLGTMTDYSKDADLLESKHQELCRRGVDANLIVSAIKSIKKKIKNGN